jgi:hypothetical protein
VGVGACDQEKAKQEGEKRKWITQFIQIHTLTITHIIVISDCLAEYAKKPIVYVRRKG